MGFVYKIVIALWRVWFYVLILLVTLVLSPFLLVSTIRESWYTTFYKVGRLWARSILFGMGFYTKIEREATFEKGKSYMLVSNHSSMMDIMLMYHVSPTPFVFVGKAELAKIPLFGFFYKRTSILVDRGNSRSKKEVFGQAQRRLNAGLGICIFPEGGVPSDRNIVLDSFKDGAFRLAIDHQIAIAPMTFYDTKKRFSYDFFSGSPGKLRVKVHPFIPTKGMTQDDRKELRNQTRDLILKDLESELA